MHPCCQSSITCTSNRTARRRASSTLPNPPPPPPPPAATRPLILPFLHSLARFHHHIHPAGTHSTCQARPPCPAAAPHATRRRAPAAPTAAPHPPPHNCICTHTSRRNSNTAANAAPPALPHRRHTARPSAAANQRHARCRPRCHAHSATSHHWHAKHNSSIATPQQQRPTRQGIAHSQPQQLARTPPLLARHFMARAACGQGSTQTTTWQAALQQLGGHAQRQLINNKTAAAGCAQMAPCPSPLAGRQHNSSTARCRRLRHASTAARMPPSPSSGRPACRVGHAQLNTSSRAQNSGEGFAAWCLQLRRSSTAATTSTQQLPLALPSLHTWCSRPPAGATRLLLLRVHACSNKNAFAHHVHSLGAAGSRACRQSGLPCAHSRFKLAVQPCSATIMLLHPWQASALTCRRCPSLCPCCCQLSRHMLSPLLANQRHPACAAGHTHRLSYCSHAVVAANKSGHTTRPALSQAQRRHATPTSAAAGWQQSTGLAATTAVAALDLHWQQAPHLPQTHGISLASSAAGQHPRMCTSTTLDTSCTRLAGRICMFAAAVTQLHLFQCSISAAPVKRLSSAPAQQGTGAAHRPATSEGRRTCAAQHMRTATATWQTRRKHPNLCYTAHSLYYSKGQLLPHTPLAACASPPLARHSSSCPALHQGQQGL